MAPGFPRCLLSIFTSDYSPEPTRLGTEQVTVTQCSWLSGCATLGSEENLVVSTTSAVVQSLFITKNQRKSQFYSYSDLTILIAVTFLLKERLSQLYIWSPNTGFLNIQNKTGCLHFPGYKTSHKGPLQKSTPPPALLQSSPSEAALSLHGYCLPILNGVWMDSDWLVGTARGKQV